MYTTIILGMQPRRSVPNKENQVMVRFIPIDGQYHIPDISKMYCGYWEYPGGCERMWSVNLEPSISGENETLKGNSS